MFSYSLNNKPESIQLDTTVIDNIFTTISQVESSKHFWVINIIFLPDKEIQTLNNQYRQKNSSTDVLSFHYHDTFTQLEDSTIAWEVILSGTKIHSQGIEYWLWSTKECYKLIIHSVLHILWYDHEKDDDYIIMKEKETKIWKQLFWIQKNWE